MIKRIVRICCLMIFLFLTVSIVWAVNGYEIVAVSGLTPTIDGEIRPGEWSDANYIVLNHTWIYVKQDGMNLYVAFSSAYPMVLEPNVTILIDVDHDDGKLLQEDDLMFWAFRNGTLGEANVKSGVWTPCTPRGWDAGPGMEEFSWQAEFNITYSKIEVVAGVEKTIGVAFLATSFDFGVYGKDTWPPNQGNIIINPSNWGDLISTGYDWIPEFPSFLILPLFMISTLLVVLVYRKKHTAS